MVLFLHHGGTLAGTSHLLPTGRIQPILRIQCCGGTAACDRSVPEIFYILFQRCGLNQQRDARAFRRWAPLRIMLRKRSNDQLRSPQFIVHDGRDSPSSILLSRPTRMGQGWIQLEYHLSTSDLTWFINLELQNGLIMSWGTTTSHYQLLTQPGYYLKSRILYVVSFRSRFCRELSSFFQSRRSPRLRNLGRLCLVRESAYPDQRGAQY